MKSEGRSTDSLWTSRKFPTSGSSILPFDFSAQTGAYPGAGLASRVDFSAFVNSMDDASFAYLCLLREYAARSLQGKALEYSGLYRAMVSQTAEEENLSRISVVEFESGGLRSRTFLSYDDFRNYIDNGAEKESLKRLFLVEDLPVRLVCLLGSRLRIHPTLFARHYSTEDSSTISDNIVSLPSIVQTSTKDGLEYESEDEDLYEPSKRRSFTLRYPIVMPRVSAKQHPDPRKCPPWLKPSERLKDQSAYPRFAVERALETPTRHDQWDTRGEISELEGQVTYWYRSLSDGGWDGKSSLIKHNSLQRY